MEKINTIRKAFGQSSNILTASQMSVIKGGATSATTIDVLSSLDYLSDTSAAAVGPISATSDDKRRDRPGGGVSTH